MKILKSCKCFSYNTNKRKFSFKYSNNLVISEEIRDALANNKPIVALESTIISHGMPYPRNITVAMEVEDVVRFNGAIPATVAIINGIPMIGLNSIDFEILANSSKSHVMKASRRDIAYAIVNNKTAATTVASTMIFAHSSGINVFATGGIGGVHRGGETTMDISADLIELSKTPVTVVSAGIKSILDIPRTLEYLETHGVPVIGYESEYFPAFFTNNVDIKSPLVVKDTLSIAKMMLTSKSLNLSTGMLVGVPNPNPADSELIQQAIDEAIKLAINNNISGYNITPFVLSQVEQITKGKSLEANISLILNNAKIASNIAKDYSSLLQNRTSYDNRKNYYGTTSAQTSNAITSTNINTDNVFRRTSGNKRAVVIGGAVVDIIGKITFDVMNSTSNIGTISTSYGGVGRNIAEKIALNSDIKTQLVTAVSNDLFGKSIINDCIDKGIDSSNIMICKEDISTAIYSAIHSKTDLLVGVADMNIFRRITVDYIKTIRSEIINSQIVILDGNLSTSTFNYITDTCYDHHIPIFFEPTSDYKCLLPLTTDAIHKIDFMKPSKSELFSMIRYCIKNNLFNDYTSAIRSLHFMDLTTDDLTVSHIEVLGCALLEIMVSKDKYKNLFKRLNKHLFISLGKDGIVWVKSDSIGKTHLQMIRSKPIDYYNIKNTNGAGDSFCAGLIIHMLTNESSDITADSIEYGVNLAVSHITKK